jgi:hypothetical protein
MIAVPALGAQRGTTMKKFWLSLLLVLAVPSAWAVIPENGWWWASNESGRGFNIEVQDNQLFFAAFAYENNGAPTWLVAGGSMTTDRDFSGALTKFSAGQCFGCAYVAPLQVAAGNLALHFTSSQTATLTINGTSLSVKRFDFWANESVPDAMMGEWTITIGESASPVYDGERIQYSQKMTGSTGPFLAGHRLGASGNIATVAYDASRGRWYSLLDSSTSFYRYFEWTTTGFNRIEGQFWIFDKSANPTGSGTFFQGFRSASATYVRTGSGPASSKVLPERERLVQDLRDRGMAESLDLDDGPADPGVLERFEALKRARAVSQ